MEQYSYVDNEGNYVTLFKKASSDEQGACPYEDSLTQAVRHPLVNGVETVDQKDGLYYSIKINFFDYIIETRSFTDDDPDGMMADFYNYVTNILSVSKNAAELLINEKLSLAKTTKQKEDILNTVEEAVKSAKNKLLKSQTV